VMVRHTVNPPLAIWIIPETEGEFFLGEVTAGVKKNRQKKMVGRWTCTPRDVVNNNVIIGWNAFHFIRK